MKGPEELVLGVSISHQYHSHERRRRQIEAAGALLFEQFCQGFLLLSPAGPVLERKRRPQIGVWYLPRRSSLVRLKTAPQHFMAFHHLLPRSLELPRVDRLCQGTNDLRDIDASALSRKAFDQHSLLQWRKGVAGLQGPDACSEVLCHNESRAYGAHAC